MKKLAFLLLSTLFVMQAEAILPPLYQTSTEIKAILGDEQLGEKLGSGDLILKIEKNDQGYLITTNKHQLQVDVNYERPKNVGPAQYKIRFREATPL